MRRPGVLAGICLALAVVPSLAKAADFGVMKGYNVFLIGNDSMTNVDSYGKIAVGGNADFNDYTVASGIGASGTNLVVGGNLNQYSGGALFGSIIVGGNATLNSPTVYGNLAANGNVDVTGGGSISGSIAYGSSIIVPNYYNSNNSISQGTTSLPVDFGAAASQMNALTTGLSALNANGTVDAFTGSHPSTLVLTGTNATQNVFNISGSLLNNSNLYTLEIDVPAGSSVVINVSGTNVTVRNFGTTLNGVSDQDLLFNFYQATTVTLDGSFNGSLLAQYATVNTTYGGFNGQLFADNLTGSIEMHNDPFQDTLSLGSSNGASNTPEASQMAVILIGLLGLLGLAGRQRLTARRSGGVAA